MSLPNLSTSASVTDNFPAVNVAVAVLWILKRLRHYSDTNTNKIPGENIVKYVKYIPNLGGQNISRLAANRLAVGGGESLPAGNETVTHSL